MLIDSARVLVVGDVGKKCLFPFQITLLVFFVENISMWRSCLFAKAAGKTSLIRLLASGKTGGRSAEPHGGMWTGNFW